MASPVFVSRPPAGFSAQALVRGFELACIGFYRSLQNPGLFTSNKVYSLFKTLALSLIIDKFLWIVDAAVEQIVSSLTSGAVPTSTISKFKTHSILNVGVLCVCITKLLLADFEIFFWESLRFFDRIRIQSSKSNRQESKKVESFESILAREISNDIEVELHVKRQFLKPFLLSTLALALLRSLIIATVMISPLFTNIVGVTLFITCFWQFSFIVGGPAALGISVLSSTFGIVSQMNLLFHLRSYETVVKMLIEPYFTQVRFTKAERDTWINSRSGVLYGHGLFFYTLVTSFPRYSNLIFCPSNASVAYLITKITDPLPASCTLGSRHLSRWISRQIIWADRDRKLRRMFVEEEGFFPRFVLLDGVLPYDGTNGNSSSSDSEEE